MKTKAITQLGIKVVTGVKAGAFSVNHSRKNTAITVKSGLKAGDGILLSNHSRRLS